MENNKHRKNFGIDKLIEMIHSGDFVLPEIQREFVWDLDAVINLWDSIFRGYPIGQLLFWEAKTSIPTYDFFDNSKTDPYLFTAKKPQWHHRSAKDSENKIIVLDGQQRLTSLFLGTLKDGILVKMRKNSNSEKRYLCIYVGKDDIDGDNDTKLFAWKSCEEEDDYISICKALESRKQSPNIKRLKERLRDRQYYASVDYVHGDKVGDVIEIFRRLNNGGRPMSKSELFLAMWFGNSQANDLRKKVDNIRLEFGDDFDVKDKTITQLLITIFGKISDNGNKINDRPETHEKITRSLPRLQRAVKETVKFLHEDCGIYSNGEMTSHNLFIPIVHLFFHFDNQLKDKMREELKCFVYRALVFDLFSKSTETTLARLKKTIDELEADGSFIKSLHKDIIEQCFMDLDKAQALDGKIDEMLNTLEKGSKTNQILLLLRKEPANVDREMFEQDHLIAADLFDETTPKALSEDRRSKFGIRQDDEIVEKYKLKDAEVRRWKRLAKKYYNRRNKLPNLWLLEKSKNASKGKKLLHIWYDGLPTDEQKKFRDETYLKSFDGHKTEMNDLKITNFEEIYDKRKDELFSEISKLLRIPK